MHATISGGLPMVLTAPTEIAMRAGGGTPRPMAAFVAHLIATAQRVPQTCARRRGAQNDAIALYSAAPSFCRTRVVERFL